MTPDNQIFAELQGISSFLAGIPRRSPYAAPVGYFDQLPQLMLQKIQSADNPQQELAALSPLLAGLSKKSPFTAPDGYFNQVPGEIAEGVSAIEQTNEVPESLHPMLVAARHINPYRVPENYFEQLPALVLQKRPVTGKLIGINKTWLKYAAAAAVIGFVALAGWLYQPKPVVIDTPKSGKELSTEVAIEMNQLSDEAFVEFADSTQLLYNGSTAINDYDDNALDMHVLLEEVSDGALQQYLGEEPAKANLLNN
jgi:hypothetical protein